MSCPVCASEHVSDEQGHLRPEGNEQPPYLMLCEVCGAKWQDDGPGTPPAPREES
jgi:hypothetical protein